MAKAQGAFTVTAEEEEETDNKITVEGIAFERRDPYGFWHCVDPKHRALEGMFTTQTKAAEAAARYHAITKASTK